MSHIQISLQYTIVGLMTRTLPADFVGPAQNESVQHRLSITRQKPFSKRLGGSVPKEAYKMLCWIRALASLRRCRKVLRQNGTARHLYF